MSRKANLSTGAKWGIGIGATVLALPIVLGAIGVGLVASKGSKMVNEDGSRAYKPRQPKGISLK